MKTPSYETLEASNKSAPLFQDLFSYSADKSSEHDKCLKAMPLLYLLENLVILFSSL